MKTFVRFAAIMLMVIAITASIHLAFLIFFNLDPFADRIILSYAGNYLLALGILFGLLNAPKKFQNSLGFLFMLGSGLKFIFFFLFLYPFYLEDGVMSRSEFFAFFLPYSVCLATETKLLINRLSRD